jgi:glutamate N-acetyltransferase/amino-acid N-acetyltransferase
MEACVSERSSEAGGQAQSPDRGAGRPAGDFFSSRWIERPEYVSELDGPALPQGFRAAGVVAGIKPSGSPDLGLLVSDAPQTTSAARFTRSGTQAAPVLLNRERCRLGALRAVVVNSGNANAATGRPGLDNAAKMQGSGAIVAGVSEDPVAVASTGVIGVPLPMYAITSGLAAAGRSLSVDGAEAFAEAIRTTDAFAKHATLEVSLPGGQVMLTAQAKGAGMISPGFATLLCFVQTDAALSAETCDLLLGVCVKRSFERVSVDGQLSTSDTVILQASGASGVAVKPETEDELRFGEALDALLRQLALLVVRDGEGARRVGRVVVRGGEEVSVHRVARAVADSSLVKTALYGGDPNWGRIIQAVGMAMPDSAPLDVEIAIEGVKVCARGSYLPHDAEALAVAVKRDEVQYEIGLPGEGAETELFFSDLGHEYVSINADYTT